jgi:hypothetical protein
MRGLEKFLFFWGIVVVTVGGIGALFFSPRPENFVILALLLPVIAYFWLRLTSPAEVSASKWSLRLILVIFVLVSLGIFAFSLNKKAALDREAAQKALVGAETLKRLEEVKNELAKLTSAGISDEEIASDVARIKEELSQLRESEALNPNLLGALESLDEIAIGEVTIIKSSVGQLDVLASADFGSASVGKITFGQNYEYFQKEESWYLIKLPNGVKGWVNAKDVKEVYPETP